MRQMTIQFLKIRNNFIYNHFCIIMNLFFIQLIFLTMVSNFQDVLSIQNLKSCEINIKPKFKILTSNKTDCPKQSKNQP